MQHFCLGPTWEFSAAIIFCPSHRQSASWAWDSLRHACSLTRGGSKNDQSSGCCRGRAVLFVNQCPRLRELKRKHGSHNPRCVFKMKTDMRLTNFTNRLCVKVMFIIWDPIQLSIITHMFSDISCVITQLILGQRHSNNYSRTTTTADRSWMSNLGVRNDTNGRSLNHGFVANGREKAVRRW